MVRTADNVPASFAKHCTKIAQDEGFEDYAIETTAGSEHGDGFMAEMINICLVGNRVVDGISKPDRLSLICKLLPSNPKRVQQFSSEFLFEREAYFYKTVLPILVDLQQSKGVSAENAFTEFPKCYVAECDPVTKNYVIIMADLRERGFRMWQRGVPIDVEAVELVLKALGRLHALSFVLRDQRPDVWQQLRSMKEVMLHMAKNPVMNGFIGNSMQFAVNAMRPSPEAEWMEKLRANWHHLWDTSLAPDAAEPFSVIGQGDCWANNFMFAFDGVS